MTRPFAAKHGTELRSASTFGPARLVLAFAPPGLVKQRCGLLPGRARSHAPVPRHLPLCLPLFSDPGDLSYPSFLIGADPW